MRKRIFYVDAVECSEMHRWHSTGEHGKVQGERDGWAAVW